MQFRQTLTQGSTPASKEAQSYAWPFFLDPLFYLFTYNMTCTACTQGGTSGRGISSGYAEPEDSEAQHFGTMRYDQVFGQDSPRSVGVKPEPSHAESSSTPVEVEVEDDVPTYGSQAPAPTTVITVTDPQKHAEQSIIPLVNPGFYTYKVITRSSQDNFRRRDTFVRRRFRDCVVWILCPL